VRWGWENEWRISDGFSEWRFWIAPIGAPSEGHVSRGNTTEDPLWHIIYQAFNHSWATDDGLARDLIAMYDALTGSRLGEKLPRPTRDRQRRLRGFDAELSRVLYSAIEAGILKYERIEVPWPFPEREERPVSKPPTPPTREDWITIVLVDEGQNPMPGVKYRIKLPSGEVVEGKSDASGRAHITGIDPGNCVVSFPDLHPTEWAGNS